MIFIIDDDKANNFLSKIMLEDAGISNFRQFRLAEEALKELEKICADGKVDDFPSVILLDLNMPAMDGWGFLGALRSLNCSFTKKPAIYLLTSSDHPDDMEKAKTYPELIDFLPKPITEEVAKTLKEKYFS